MIDSRKLKELVRLMVENGLTEVDLRDSEMQVTLRREPKQQTAEVVHAAPITAAPAPSVPAAAPAAPAVPADDDGGFLKIESPMVGTFYQAANPDSPAFVKVGDEVSPESVVCLVEAMKIFNEIKAECSGTVKKILVKNGESVEFGQPLFLVEG